MSNPICVIIGASHAGVNCAFALRKEGWTGKIILYDTDPELPYHRPPLSKTYLTDNGGFETSPLKSKESYEREEIQLNLGTTVASIDSGKKRVLLSDGAVQAYDKLVLATGARALLPPIPGLPKAKNVFTLRTLSDVEGIRSALGKSPDKKKVVVIGGGYIGLEIAASLRKLGSDVVVLEREERILARVTIAEMSHFFHSLHEQQGVEILTGKDVIAIQNTDGSNKVCCADGTYYQADIIIVGVGIIVNTELAQEARLSLENGIKVDTAARTAQEGIYAIGDCTYHHNPHYGLYVRLESVQNAVDQAKVAAAAICGKEVVYDTIPWFWSDQYDVKLQIVGIAAGYDHYIVRKEEKEQPCFSIWYFRGHKLLAVDAINNAKAFVLGTKFIKSGEQIDQIKLVDTNVALKPVALVTAS